MARITGLQAAPQLNGELCSVLRPAETPDRTVVRTRHGEKSLRRANLVTGRVVYPKGSFGAAAALFAATALATAGAFLLPAGFLRAFAAAVLPTLLPLWFGLTLFYGYVLHRPVKASDLRVPSVSEMGSGAPAARLIAAVGLLGAGLVLAGTMRLYDEALLPRLGPMPPPPPPAHTLEEVAMADALDGDTADGEPIPATDGDAAVDAAVDASTAASPAASDAAEAGRSTPADGAVNDTAEDDEDAAGDAGADLLAANATNSSNTTLPPQVPPEWMPGRSVLWGYIAAVSIILQGFISFEARLSVWSVLHVIVAVAFVVGALQHAQQSGAILSSVRGEPITSLSPWVASAVKLRQNVAVFGPLLVMALPLYAQVTSSTSQASRAATRHGFGSRNLLQASGLQGSVRMGQWSAMIVFAFFFCTYAVDLWFVCAAIDADMATDASVTRVEM